MLTRGGGVGKSTYKLLGEPVFSLAREDGQLMLFYPKRENSTVQNMKKRLRHVIDRHTKGLVNRLNTRLMNQSGILKRKLPSLKARFEFFMTRPICCFHLRSYWLRGVPSLRCSTITCPAMRPPTMAMVMPAPFDGRTIPAASPTNT